MRAIVQRARWARVTVDGAVVGEIGIGAAILVGCTHSDGEAEADKLADKIFQLRVLTNEDRTNHEFSLAQSDSPQALVVSQFTLYANTTKGRRPSWLDAAPGSHAEPLVERVATRLEQLGCRVARGRFGADMLVEVANDGPMTILLEV
jgi:D-tyrosyl-tRNA(Tyr) deacylase